MVHDHKSPLTIPLQSLDPPAATAHVASFITHVRPEHSEALVDWLQQRGVEIHARSADGKLALVIECEHEQGILTLLDALREQAGVLSAALIYHEIITLEEAPL